MHTTMHVYACSQPTDPDSRAFHSLHGYYLFVANKHGMFVLKFGNNLADRPGPILERISRKMLHIRLICM